MAKRQRNIDNGATGAAKLKRTRKSVPRESPSQRSSVYRGVTRHRWTGRYEAHLWDKNCWNESQNKKGKQVYLGAYDDEEAAAHAYDLAALKYWGQDTILNFPISAYEEELKEMESQTREEYIGSLRRKSSGFSRGVSKYRGVARHHHNGRWEARIGRVFGNKYLYLGTYATQEEAATAYDIAAIEYRGLNAITNFGLSRYIKWLRPNAEGAIGSYPPTGIPMPHVDVSDVPEPMRARGGGAGTSALGLLLQSSKFKEMLQKASPETTAAAAAATSSSSSAPATPNSCGDNKSLLQCNFPDYIQTYFECQNGRSFIEEEDDSIFGEFGDFMSSPLIEGV
ncbi:AP2-like ethylene-responsive transcription factor At1g16060 [Zingiber officinale]|uniref:AP2-like ethylene-responsive transcription factor At1g16060 n=1 Tax=Zingiber officinale TaxID=94328 RepID=UPI001C4B8EE4|nr:AP2-like ethylene-responsive transcription factor At1g16060 [Zingiber officinale]